MILERVFHLLPMMLPAGINTNEFDGGGVIHTGNQKS